MKVVYFFVLVLMPSVFSAQQLVYQNLIQGEVVAFGYSPWQNDVTDTLYYELDVNSSINQVLLFYTSYNAPEDETIYINNNPINLSNENNITLSDFEAFYGLGTIIEYKTLLNDITDIISSTDTSIIITTQFTDVVSNAYSHFYFLILADNQNLPIVNSTVIVNNFDSDSSLTYDISNLNIIDTTHAVGISTNCTAHCSTINDGSYLYVNNDSIGLIKGNDYNTPIDCNGIRGDFQYQANNLIALGDDTANYFMNGFDALADISHNIPTTDFINLKIEYEGKNNPFNSYAIYSNPFFQFFLTYSTPCDTFTVDVPKEINVCRGETALINVSGGNSYEWLPQVGLSCYNCANPVFNGDSTMYYTVRIWNNDSCSKVMPVHVVIQENPIIPDYIVEGSDCVPNNTGHVYATFIPQPSVFSIDGGTNQSTTHFYGLTAGAHQLTVTDAANGCTSDSSLIVPAIINITAGIDANPLSGELPLEVNFANTSIGNTSQYWYLEQDTILSAGFSNVFNQSGVYPVTLVAYDTHPHCSDTAQVIILVETPFKIIAPTLVQAPSAAYPITTYGVIEMKYTLYNSLGQKVYETELKNISDGQQNLWQRREYNRATYLYRIEATGENGEKKEFTGKVLVM